MKKSKKTKINLLTSPNKENKNKCLIISEDLESKKNNNDIAENNICIKSNIDLMKSAKIIEDSINQIEREMIDFKKHNLHVKQQLKILLDENK